eukprot:gene13633-4534_t
MDCIESLEVKLSEADKEQRNNSSSGWFRSRFGLPMRSQSIISRRAVEHRQEMVLCQRKLKRQNGRRNTSSFEERIPADESCNTRNGRFSWKSFKHFFRKMRQRQERSSSTTSESSNITIDVDGHRLEDSPVLPRAILSDCILNNTAAGDGEAPSGCFLIKPAVKENGYCIPRMIHKVVNCSWYWGNIDRFEAAVALQTKVDGYFLLRKSAHPDFLFTISFKRFHKTMHVRIEAGYDGVESQNSFEETIFLPWIMPGRFSPTYSSLLELIDGCCQPYEGNIVSNPPLLLSPLNRKTAFSLKDLARAAIYKHCHYMDIDFLQIPEELKHFLREYRYKSKLNPDI